MKKQVLAFVTIVGFVLFGLSPTILAKMNDKVDKREIAAQRTIYLPLVNRNSHQCTPEKINLCPQRLQKILLAIKNNKQYKFVAQCMDTYLMCSVELYNYLANPPIGINPAAPLESPDYIGRGNQAEFDIPNEKSAIHLYFWKPDKLIFHHFYYPPW